MEAITLDLQAEATQQHGKPWPLLLFNAVGIANVMQGFNIANEYRYFHIGAGIVMFASAVGYYYLYKPTVVVFDENGIAGRTSRHRSIQLQWTDIAQMDIAMYSITLRLRSGGTVVIDLSNCTYQQHQELKPKIAGIAQQKNVVVHAA